MGAIAPVEFTVLGTVGATLDGEPIPPGTRKEHLLLGLLLVHANQTVTLDQIIEALWADDVPSRPEASIRAYVSNLRRSISSADDDPKQILATESGGYRLNAECDLIDACRFETDVAEIITEATELTLEQQADRLDKSLADVGGAAFAEFVYEDFAAIESARLNELVLAARERRCELAVELGDAAAWLPTITALAAKHPFRERLHAVQMRSLVATGRHGEALRVFAEHRRRLVEEMGIEPGPELRALEQEVLALDAVEVPASGMLLVPPPAEQSDSTLAEPVLEVAERRQMTALAIVRLINSVDPEEVDASQAAARQQWRDVVAEHGATTEDIPDGMLVHIGYPIARERDAERAVRAALTIVSLDPDCAVGVATSEVLASPGVDGPRFTGDGPSNALRLALAARPGEVAVGDATRRLAQDQIRFEEADGRTIAVAVSISLDVGDLREPVGRDEELALAGRIMKEALAGNGRSLVVTGDAGIGKSTFVGHLATRFGSKPLSFVGSPFHTDTALWPVAVGLEDHPDLTVPEVLAGWSRMGTAAVAEMAPDPADRRSMLLDAAFDAILAHAESQPTLCVFDDVHSMDATTLELIAALIEAAPTSPLLVVIAIRGSDHLGFADGPHTTSIGLGPLADTTAHELVREVAGESVPETTISAIVERAAGVPLFLEELARPLPSSTDTGRVIPETVHDLLMARLDAVPSARPTLQMAGVAGDGFDADLLIAIGADASRVEADLTSLCGAGILVRERRRSGVRYRFRHGLIRETAYEAVPKSRRSELHRHVVGALLEHDPGIIETTPELLARHHEAAGDLPDALRAWLRAATRSLALSALAEASEAIRRGLAVADRLDDSGRSSVSAEIVDLWLARGVVTTQQGGPASPEARAVYDHLVDELSASMDRAQRFRARWGRWFVLSTGWNTPEAFVAAKEVHSAAEDSGDTALRIEGHHVMWATLMTVGEFEQALDHRDHAWAMYDRDIHHSLTYEFGGHDPGVCMHSISGLAYWMTGEPDEARRELSASIRLGEELGHAYSRLEASFGPVTIAVLERDVEVLRSEADALERLTDTGALPATAAGYIDGCRGVAHISLGELDDGLALLERGANAWAELWASYCLPFDSEMARARAAVGRLDEALAGLDTILARDTRGQWWDSELLRVRAIALAAQGDHAEAQATLKRAIEVAQSQGAVALEQRAMKSLATLDRRDDAST